MISIIIASVKKELLHKVVENIGNTIGVEFEVLSVDNSDSTMSLCEIYNNGAEKAKYEIVCYMHEDVEIQTENWGQIVLQQFNSNAKLGIIGVAGSSYKPLAPSGWGGDSYTGLTTFSNFLQSYKESNRVEHLLNNPTAERLAKVVCVDGFWLCTQKSIAIEKRFDEEMLKGFHCYDIDYCLNVGQEYDVCVTFDILIRHFSEGNVDKNWLFDTLNVNEKWKSILPKSVAAIPIDYQRNLEKIALKNYIKFLIKYKVSLGEILKRIGGYKKAKFMTSKLYLKLRFYALTYYFKKAGN